MKKSSKLLALILVLTVIFGTVSPAVSAERNSEVNSQNKQNVRQCMNFDDIFRQKYAAFFAIKPFAKLVKNLVMAKFIRSTARQNNAFTREIEIYIVGLLADAACTAKKEGLSNFIAGVGVEIAKILYEAIKNEYKDKEINF